MEKIEKKKLSLKLTLLSGQWQLAGRKSWTLLPIIATLRAGITAGSGVSEGTRARSPFWSTDNGGKEENKRMFNEKVRHILWIWSRFTTFVCVCVLRWIGGIESASGIEENTWIPWPV